MSTSCENCKRIIEERDSNLDSLADRETSLCEDCQRLKEPTAPGTAPARPRYHETTFYDHIPTFQRFKNERNNDKITQKCEQDFLVLNGSFIDIKSGGTDKTDDDSGDNNTTTHADLMRIHNKMVGNSKSFDSAATDDNVKDEHQPNEPIPNPQPATSLEIPRAPVYCPITACGKVIGLSSMLSHILKDHSGIDGIQCHEVTSSNRSIVLLDTRNLNYGETHCLGVLAFKDDQTGATTGQKMPNAFLSEEYKHLNDHLPILIMASVTSFGAMLDEEEPVPKWADPSNKKHHLLIIWLITMTSVPIFGTLTVCDKLMTNSRSTIIQSRRMYESQKPAQFMAYELNFLRLNSGEIKLLTVDNTELITLEILIHGYNY